MSTIGNLLEESAKVMWNPAAEAIVSSLATMDNFTKGITSIKINPEVSNCPAMW
jgi:phage terminase large subunit-like protein